MTRAVASGTKAICIGAAMRSTNVTLTAGREKEGNAVSHVSGYFRAKQFEILTEQRAH